MRCSRVWPSTFSFAIRRGPAPIAVSVTNNGAVPVLAPGTRQRVAFAAEHAVLLPAGRLAEQGE